MSYALTTKSATEHLLETKIPLTRIKRPTAAIVLCFVSIYRALDTLDIPFDPQYPHLRLALAQTTWIFNIQNVQPRHCPDCSAYIRVRFQSCCQTVTSVCRHHTAAASSAMANQSPMISIPKKSTDEVDWTTPIRNLISQSYGENPDNYAAECAALQRCRQDAVRGAGSDTTGNCPTKNILVRD